MKRILAISLLLLFGLPLVAPLLAQPPDPNAALPACCRLNGKHHCTGMMAPSPNSPGQTISAARCCESFPRSIAPSQHFGLSLGAASPNAQRLVIQPAVRLPDFTRVRLVHDHSTPKRGPPALPLS